jgi:phosphate transport system ATP-binding protein
MSSALIETDRLGLRYGGRLVLDDVTLRIPRGSITAVVGPSGCGKSSFLQCLNRLTDLIPHAAVAGSILYAGQEITNGDLDVVAHRRRVGMIFQKPNPFPMSIWRNLELALRVHVAGDRADRAASIEAALRSVGLWDEVKDRLSAPAASLSGGQQQRLCLARALVLEPEVLLLDEPCSALDPISSGVVEDLVRELRARYTIVIVTHNLTQARRVADEVAIFWMRDGVGRLIEAGPAAQVFESPRDPLAAAYVNGARG